MTTAARPTFDPAKGKAEAQFSHLTSAKDLPSHTRLKTRKPGQGYTVEELRQELKEAERKHYEAKQLTHDTATTESSTEESQSALAVNRAKYIEMAQMLDAASDEESENGEESDGEESVESGSEGSDEESDEDETALLMRELEKIKRERADEKAREEREAEERKLMNAGSVMGANPLLKGGQEFSVKRRWDDDVVFRNQAKGDDGKSQKRFVNDMLRSDFHRKFMSKYIQ
ncbi:Pre-mRNA-splicing factor Cwf15/Cwc15 [Kickxella alabastrina]|uniref:Pre-mRNA-splicing factor Cwf15/Cwc15 n=1 Tax=Kickxella alabastrina TaxID=61397 RepID=UPI00222100CF|nr:Pre-mRNA-splicing factor Cwf15/Cwc15 [Kickxella alabastrina]KAI7823988.1 Pre-mRNA-splicing factor Cwf15/Cwc15 [Kickxella alabastrina]